MIHHTWTLSSSRFGTFDRSVWPVAVSTTLYVRTSEPRAARPVRIDIPYVRAAARIRCIWRFGVVEASGSGAAFSVAVARPRPRLPGDAWERRRGSIGGATLVRHRVRDHTQRWTRAPLGADGRMPLALRGLGLVGEGGH